MPCDTVVTNTVNLGEVATKHTDLLEKALRAEFTSVFRKGENFSFLADGRRVDLASGRATSQIGEAALQAVVGRVNQAVAREAVVQAARRFGWTVQKGASANEFAIVRS